MNKAVTIIFLIFTTTAILASASQNNINVLSSEPNSGIIINHNPGPLSPVILFNNTFSSNALAGATTWMKSKTPYYWQRQTNWCWATSLAMLHQWWSPTDSVLGSAYDQQAEIVQYIKGSVVNAAANADEILRVLREWGQIDATYEDFILTFKGEGKLLSTSPPTGYTDDPKSWLSYVEAPVIACIDTDTPIDGQANHAVLIVGYDDSLNSGSVFIHDPWTSNWWPGHSSEPCYELTLTYSEFNQRWNTWFEGPIWAKKYRGMITGIPGDNDFPGATVGISGLPSSILDSETYTMRFSLQCSGDDKGSSRYSWAQGIFVRVFAGELTSASAGGFKSFQCYDENANPIPVAGAKIIEFWTDYALPPSSTIYAYATVKPTQLGTLTVKYRGWITDEDDRVHCTLHTYNIDDDRPGTLTTYTAEPLYRRDPTDSYNDREDFLQYPTKSASSSVSDDDTSGPTYSNLKSFPSSPVEDSHSGSIRIQGDAIDPSGVSSVYLGYGYHGVIDYWKSPSGSSGNTYWYDIPRSEWSLHVGETIVWRIHAYDDDKDRPNDREDSYSPWGPNIEIRDDDTTSPSYSGQTTSPSGTMYDSYSSYIRLQINWDDSSGIYEVKFRYRYGSGSWMSWRSQTGSSGKTYWYDISRSEWTNHIDKTVYWESYATDNDNDRSGDRLTKYTPTFTGPTIRDDDTTGPSFSDPTSTGDIYDEYMGSYRIDITVTDPSGVYVVNLRYRFDGTWSSWYTASGSSGSHYWYDIQRSEWIQHVPSIVHFQVYAEDFDNDRSNDRASSTSVEYTAGNIGDDDMEGPNILNPSSSGDVLDSNMGSYRIQADVTDANGISKVELKYRFGAGAWSSWHDYSGVSGNSYWYDISRGEWINHVGEIVYFQVHAIDNDNDRVGDSSDSYSSEYPGGIIYDDDTSPPTIANPTCTYEAATKSYKPQITVTDESGIQQVLFRYKFDAGTWTDWKSPSGSSGDTYWYIVSESEWTGHTTLYWQVFAEDNDNDRANDRSSLTSPQYECDLTMPTYMLTIELVGNGTTDPSPGNYTYPEGENATVTAYPDHRWEFDRWELDGLNSTTNPITVTMDKNYTLVAVFVEMPPQYELIIQVVGNGTTDPGIGNYTYSEGENVTVTAYPDSGWRLDHWDLNGVNAGSNMNYTVYMDKNYALTALFIEKFIITELKVGWNLVALPCNNSVSLSSITVHVNETTYSWSDAVANGYLINAVFNWTRESPQHYELVDKLCPGFGYWIYANVQCQLQASGYISSTGFITTILPGWSLIGLPLEETCIQIDNLWVYKDGNWYSWSDAVANGYLINAVFNWTRESPQHYELVDKLCPGFGYWIYANELLQIWWQKPAASPTMLNSDGMEANSNPPSPPPPPFSDAHSNMTVPYVHLQRTRKEVKI